MSQLRNMQHRKYSQFEHLEMKNKVKTLPFMFICLNGTNLYWAHYTLPLDHQKY